MQLQLNAERTRRAWGRHAEMEKGAACLKADADDYALSSVAHAITNGGDSTLGASGHSTLISIRAELLETLSSVASKIAG